MSAAPTPAARAILTQALTPVLTGAYEVYVPAQLGRLYFADHPGQVLELLEALVGLEYGRHRQRDPQGRALASRVAREPGLLLRGARGEAEIYACRARARPLFQVGDWVHFFNLSTAYQIVGIGLYEDPRRLGGTTWAYYYAGAAGAGRPITEAQTMAAART
ncbi:hypothetical protein GKZ68_20995 (plasmid) [Hymenobacter sp. BRD128]|uniref:hypothetical protein n=1 Tax=Hymenobacter sp. BRD128 TaxID=2675878 RepID=UPI0015663026|nr:hypothetical protein [Hymenobacter sp. BRD128]QKG59160.1 hypothetical protein GKZ68_20995 [Hymenobacter sp. BRD128]